MRNILLSITLVLSLVSFQAYAASPSVENTLGASPKTSLSNQSNERSINGSSGLKTDMVTDEPFLEFINESENIIKNNLATFNRVDSEIESNAYLSDARLLYLYNKVKTVLNEIPSVKKKVEKILSDNEALVNPSASMQSESKDAQQKLSNSVRNISNEYESVINKSKSLLIGIDTVAKKGDLILNKISDKRSEMKLKGYLRQSVPLYNVDILTKSASQVGFVATTMVYQVHDIISRLCSGLIQIQAAFVFVLALAFVIWVFFFVRPYFKNLLESIRSDKKPGSVKKLAVVGLRLLLMGILPVVLALSILFSVNYVTNLTPNQDYFFLFLIASLAFAWNAGALSASILSVRNKPYRLVNLSSDLAQGLKIRLNALIFFFSIVWFFSTITGVIPMPPEFVQVARLILRVFACVVIFMILQKRFWYKLVKTDGDVSFKLRLILFARWFSLLVVLTNPILIICGYVNLANALFYAITQTGALIVLMYLILTLLSQGIPHLLNGHNISSKLQKRFAMSDRGKELFVYWVVMILHFIVWVSSAAVFLIIWGMDPLKLHRWVESILFGFNVGPYHFSLIGIITALAAFFLVIAITKNIQHFTEKQVLAYTNLTEGSQQAMLTAFGYIGYAAAILVAINMLGLQISSLFYILGGLSVGVGLALTPVVTNFISGLLMLAERPVKKGDLVEISGIIGTVSKVNVRTTEIITGQKATVLVPNSEIMSKVLTNWGYDNRAKRRLDLNIGVAYGTDTNKVTELLLECAKAQDGVVENPEPFVTFKDFGESSLDFALHVYLRKFNTAVGVGSQLRHSINRKFVENGIEMPFPQRDIHIIKDDDSENKKN